MRRKQKKPMEVVAKRNCKKLKLALVTKNMGKASCRRKKRGSSLFWWFCTPILGVTFTVNAASLGAAQEQSASGGQGVGAPASAPMGPYVPITSPARTPGQLDVFSPGFFSNQESPPVNRKVDGRYTAPVDTLNDQERNEVIDQCRISTPANQNGSQAFNQCYNEGKQKRLHELESQRVEIENRSRTGRGEPQLGVP